MKKDEMKEKTEKTLKVIQKQSDSFLAKMEFVKTKLGEFAPSVMIAIGVTLMIAFFNHPSTVFYGAIVGLIFAAPVIKKMFFDRGDKQENNVESKAKKTKKKESETKVAAKVEVVKEEDKK